MLNLAAYRSLYLRSRISCIMTHAEDGSRSHKRSSSILLLMALLAQPGYTFTTLTPSEVAARVAKAFGFRPLESHKLLFGPWIYRSLIKLKARNSPRTGPLRKVRRAAEIAIETPLSKGFDLLRGFAD